MFPGVSTLASPAAERSLREASFAENVKLEGHQRDVLYVTDS